MKQELCRPYCIYYKPDRNETLACKGFSVVEALLEAGQEIVFTKFAATSRAGRTVETLLVQEMCGTCDFQENDCDFMSDEAAPPCGGFLLLGRLLEAEAVTVADIRRVLPKKEEP